MSNHAEERFDRVMKSKAALDLMESIRTYDGLIAEGWPADKAFMVAFMGIMVWHVPGLKPIPRPDPPYFSVASLYKAAQQAEADIAAYHREFSAQLEFLKGVMKKYG
jgi:hypothetical protein